MAAKSTIWVEGHEKMVDLILTREGKGRERRREEREMREREREAFVSCDVTAQNERN